MKRQTHGLKALGLVLEIIGLVLGHCFGSLLSLCRTFESSRVYISVKANDDDAVVAAAAAKESIRWYILILSLTFHPLQKNYFKSPSKNTLSYMYLRAKSGQATRASCDRPLAFWDLAPSPSPSNIRLGLLLPRVPSAKCRVPCKGDTQYSCRSLQDFDIIQLAFPAQISEINKSK